MIPPIVAAFGLDEKVRMEDALSEEGIDFNGDIDFDDPELLAAMQMFLDMSQEEMEEVMKDLSAVLGDDPEALEAMEEVMKEIPNMKSTDEIQSILEGLQSEQAVKAATHNALDAIGKAEWTTIWERQDLILEAVIQSGKISPEDAATFKTDNKAWEAELKMIWEELQAESSKESKHEL